MRATVLLSSSIALCALASASAQGIVDPTGFKNTEAPYNLNLGFGYNSNSGWRYQQIHDGLKGAKATINQLALRRDQQRGRFSSHSFRCTLILSTAAVTYDNIDATFDKNHGANKQTVMNFVEVKWPSTRPDTVPSPFEYVLKFDKPYNFDGTAGGLCWEAQISNQQGILSTMYFDAAYSRSTNPAMALQYFGEGCVHSTRVNPMGATGQGSMNWNSQVGTLYLYGQELPINTLVIGVLGLSRVNFSGIPLPLTFPGSVSAYSGACNLYVSLDIVIPGTANSGGNATITFPVPARQEFAGAKIYGQYLAIDDASGSLLPFTTSSGVEYQWVAPYDLPMISRNHATNNFSPTGSVSKDNGYVCEAR